MFGKSEKLFERFQRIWSRLRDVAALPFSFVGRRRILASGRFRTWPLLFPLARLYRLTIARRTRVVAVIGSLGKTTTTRAVTAALGRPIAHIIGWNGGGFLAEALFHIQRFDRNAVIEVGIKHIGHMKAHSRLLKPDVAVVVSIATEHHRTLGSLASIRNEKATIVRELAASGLAVLNGDDENVLWMRSTTKATVLTYGFDPSNDVWASDYRSVGAEGGRFTLHVGGDTHVVKMRLVGRHMVYPILAALTVARAEGMDWAEALYAMESLPPTPHRLQPRILPDGTVLLMDDYKATFETIEPAMCALSDMPAHKRIVVLGETYEPPGDEAESYFRVGEMASQACDQLIFVGAERRYRSLTEGAIFGGMNREEIVSTGMDVLGIADLLQPELGPGVAILFKATGRQRLERIALRLEGRDGKCLRSLCRAPISLDCADCQQLTRS